MTGRLSSNAHTSWRSPNGTGRCRAKTWVPIGDHSRMGTENTTAIRNRLRRSATIAVIDTVRPSWDGFGSRDGPAERGSGSARGSQR
jgi:hypothetical protein